MSDTALQTHQKILQDAQIVLGVSHDAIFSVDLDGVVWIWSPGAEALYGRPTAEVRGRHLEILFHPTELPRLLREIVPKTLRDGHGRAELRQLKAGGQEMLTELRCARLRDGSGAPVGWLGCVRDLTTERRAATSVRETHERLLEVSEKLVRAQESERRRIARELHDDLGQRLTFLSFSLSALGSGLSEESLEQAAEEIERLQAEAQRAVRDLGGLSRELHPVSFQRQEITSLLKSYCGEFSLRAGLDIELAIDNVGESGFDLPPPVLLGLFRIVQEALRNVLVHSGADRARVTLGRHGEELELVIEDNGRGFERSATDGLGLISMAERARLFAGELSIKSRPGEGTRIEIRVPLRVADAGHPGAGHPGAGHPGARHRKTLETGDISSERHIGPYRLLKRIGQGGMGVVYLAEQKEPVPRRVAIKLLRTPMAEGKELLRFDVERRALGRMEHPNVARIYGAETTEEGDPYLVMEYIDGLSITEHCDQRRMDLESRLGLFIATCRGVEHGHQKRIIHRDLKPANVLVTEHGGSAVPKVIDFGIAKAIDHPLAAGTVALTGQSLLGSPAYTGPEVLGGGEADMRSDMYSLGVLLYELLVGEAPFEIHESTLAQSLKELMERDSLRPPSDFWQSLDLDVKAQRAERRGADAGALERRLRGDLDNIVMKAMAEEPEHRYAGAGELVADIERFLRHEPVLASPPSRLYTLVKFVRRHRVWVAAAALILLSVAAGLLTTTREAHRANREAATAEHVIQFMTEMFEASSPFAGDPAEITVRDLLDRGAEKARKELTEQPEARARLLDTLGTIHADLGLYKQALPLLEESLAIQEKLEGDELDRATTLRRIAGVHREQAQFRQAKERLFRALNLAERAAGPIHHEVGRIRLELAYALRVLDRLPEAKEQADRAVDIFERIKGPYGSEVGEGLQIVAIIARAQGDLGRAESALKRAIKIPRHTIAGKLDHGTALATLADLYSERGDFEHAEPLYLEGLEIYETHLGPEHPFVANMLGSVALLDSKTGRFERAESALRRAIEIQERTPGGRNLALAGALSLLASVYLLQGDLDRPAHLLHLGLEVLEETVGLDHGRAVGVYGRLGLVHRERRDFAQAERFFLQSLGVYPDTVMNAKVALYSTELANLYCDVGRPQQAIPRLAEARAFYESRAEQVNGYSPERLHLAKLYLAQGRTYDLRGEPEAAREAWQRSIELVTPLAASEDWLPKSLLAEALLRLGRVEEAEPLVEKLRALGLRLPSFVKLCREAGLAADEGEGPSAPRKKHGGQ